jgi:sulfocyanin
MSCTHNVTVFTDGLTPGTHTLYAMLADNLHAAISPTAMASIKIRVTSGSMNGGSPRAVPTKRPAPPATGPWLKWDAATHTAALTLIAGYNDAQSGFNFNGAGNGNMVISIPVGARVTVTFSNKGSLPHSAVVTPWSNRTGTSGFPAAFSGSSSPNPASGITAGTTQHFSFTAVKEGKYAIVCAVPGHAAAGMWDVFTVTHGGQPSVTVH